MAGITTAMATSFKAEVLDSLHNFLATVTPTGNNAGSVTACTGVSSMTGVAVGMGVSGTNVAAGSVVASTDSSTAFTLSKATTGSISGGTFTIAGDVFKIALFIGTPTGTWDATALNYGTGAGSPTTSNMGTDEVASGGGYTTGGIALTQTSPSTTGTTAFLTFGNVSWTTASFTTLGCMIYNSSQRGEGVANRCVAVFNFGITSVSSGTLSLIFPSNTSTTAIIRLA